MNPLFTAEGKINSDVLTREDSKLRSAIFQAFHVRKFENAINAVKAFQDNEIKVMKSRKKKEDIKAKTSEKSVKSRDIQSEIDPC